MIIHTTFKATVTIKATFTHDDALTIDEIHEEANQAIQSALQQDATGLYDFELLEVSIFDTTPKRG